MCMCGGCKSFYFFKYDGEEKLHPDIARHPSGAQKLQVGGIETSLTYNPNRRGQRDPRDSNKL